MKRKMGMGRFFLNFFIMLLGIISAMALVAVFSVEKISGNSMEPVLLKGDIVVINRVAYVSGKPKVGEIVSFHSSVQRIEDYGIISFKKVEEVENSKVLLYSNCKTANKADEQELFKSSNCIDEEINQIAIDELDGQVVARVLPISNFKIF